MSKFYFNLGLIFLMGSFVQAEETLRPPAYPLVVHHPYFSIWSSTDELAESFPRHWTGRTQGMASYVKIDGKSYRLMGKPEMVTAKMRQTSVQVLPTQTIYIFEDGGVRLTLTFTTPTLPEDLMVFSRPATYLTWAFQAMDGKSHSVQIYYDQSAELCVNTPEQKVAWSRISIEGLEAMRMGTVEQPILEKKGDNLRIDWGYQWLAVKKQEGLSTAMVSDKMARNTFLKEGKLPSEEDLHMPRPANEDWIVQACCWNLPAVKEETVSRWLVVAYDDEYALEYLQQKLRPFWRHTGMDARQMLKQAADEYEALCQRCTDFDAKLWTAAEKAGGLEYAQLCAIAYRQANGAHTLVVLPDGRPMLVSKENFSNGCAATVDILYPTAPIYIFLSNDLLKATLTPVMEYVVSGRWKFPFAPHDVGTYPKLNGQVYGGGETNEENQMPVEETGNILILMNVVARLDGNTEYARQYWPQLRNWAEYLLEKGFDPENQLCTDDFAGHLAHNVNLSAKAIVAIACFAELCEKEGHLEDAQRFRTQAETFAKMWVEQADDGDHFRLAFDRPGTWSQKYNLVWDKLLALNLFPASVTTKEIAFYKTKLNVYGLPLDNRADYTKTDWEVWTATLADNPADFDALMKPVYAFVSATPQRVPLTDWYFTSNAKKSMFQARSVVGGVFIKMLEGKLSPR